MTTIGAYIESLLRSPERFRTLRGLHPTTDHHGLPLFSVSGAGVRFSVMHEGRAKSLLCPLSPDPHPWAAESDRILNITNKNNPYIAPCEVLRGELLAFDTAGEARRIDVMLCERPGGVSLPTFLRANLNRSDRRPLREVLCGIAAMAASLASDGITHGNLKPENIYITPEGRPCAVDFAARPRPAAPCSGRPTEDRLAAGDDMALGLLALNTFLLGCEPGLFAILDGAEMFRPAAFRAIEKHIRTQAEFSKLRSVEHLLDLMAPPQAISHTTGPKKNGPAVKSGSAERPNPAVQHEPPLKHNPPSRGELCNALRRLSITPFGPMPILLALSAETRDTEIPVIEGAPAMERSAGLAAEDTSLRVDFRRCEEVCDIFDTLIRFRLNGKWGFADRYGRRLSAEEYLSAEDFYEGRAKVETPSGCGLIDRAGEYVMPPMYEILEWHGEDNIATACREGAWEVYDRGGRQLTSEAYDWIGGVAEGILIVRRGNKLGYITTSGSPITGFRYDEAFSFSDGSALVTSGGETYRIDRMGQREK